MVKKTKSSKKWKQSLVSVIVTPNLFVVPNEILDEISVASFDIFAGWVASILVLGATFKIKLVYVKTVFQSVHGFLGAKSMLKDNVKLFCVKFASQMSLEAAFLVELTSFVYLATLKIAKSLVISESGSLSAAVALHDVPLGMSVANIKMALSVFGSVTYVVLKLVGIWQYVVVYFEKLNSAVSALNHWSVLVNKDNIRILPLVNQNKIILSCDKFKAKLVNLFFRCTAFEINDMISQVGGWTCFIPHSPESGHCSWFALVIFGSQADLNSAIVKTEMNHLAADCKISPPSPFKLPKMFTSCFVDPKSYVKASASLNSSGFPPLLPFVFSLVTVNNPLVLSRLSFLKSDLTKLSVLIKFIVKPIGFLVATFEQFINNDLVSSSALSLKINEVLVHMGSFSKTVGKLGREVVSLKKECYMEDIDMSGNSELLPVVSDELLPPLTLYRHILRTHRILPPALRVLGNDYVKSEFRLHRDIENPIQIVGFLGQWQLYLETLQKQIQEAPLKRNETGEIIVTGKKFDNDTLDKFSEQQLGQLYVLREEAKSLGLKSQDGTKE
ncbi:hypothetical protein G9A89_011854 [Geosiphon pyriformis]|nr:hypothetical protein G9A89_011854 [Geosiphon pyriformis]